MASHDLISPSEFARFIGPDHAKSTNICHLNCQSIRNKGDDIDAFFSSFDREFHLIMLSETWYDINSVPWCPPNYQCFTASRTSCRGGGISMLLQQSILADRIDQFCCITDDFEVLTVLCTRTVYSVFYRPPNGSLVSFSCFIENLFGFISDNKYKAIFGGDFNIDMSATTSVTRNFNLLISTHGFLNVISTPTRITSYTSTCIDLFLTNFNPAYIKSGVLSGGISDHMPIFLSLNQNIDKVNTRTRTGQCITENRLENFRNQLCQLDWSEVYCAIDSNTAYESFLQIFKTAYDANFPLLTTQARPRNVRLID